jgi:AraC-like DNA-binding protein
MPSAPDRAGVRYLGRHRFGEAVRHRATQAEAAEAAVSDLYLPNRVELTGGSAPLDFRMTGLRVGALTAGRLTYGRAVRLTTGAAENFHVNLPLRGRAVSRLRGRAPVHTEVGQAAAFSPGPGAEVTWSEDCVQLCLMVPRGALESELEALLQRPLHEGLRFERTADLDSELATRWMGALHLLLGEMDRPSGMASYAAAGRHMEGLVLDGLLLGLPHNYTASLQQPFGSTGGDATARAVRTAVELMEDRPGDPWTTTRLAVAVHLAVRTLQEGFGRELGMPPMTYLRRVRLRHARDTLVRADPGSTTVRAVATGLGFAHMGRFTAAYRDHYGENPSTTLHRQAGDGW